MVKRLRTLSAVPVAGGLAAGVAMLVDAGSVTGVLGIILLPVGAAGICLAYSWDRERTYLGYGTLVWIVVAVVGTIWFERRTDGETVPWIAGLLLAVWAYAGIFVGLWIVREAVEAARGEGLVGGLLRALSVVPVAAGLATGAALLADSELLADSGSPWEILAFVLVPLGFAGITLAYSRGRFPAYRGYGGVVVLVAAIVGGVSLGEQDRDDELPSFLVGFISFGGLGLVGMVLGGLGLEIWGSVKRARGRG